MERFSGAARVGFKTSAPCRNVVPVPRLMNDLRSEENEIVNECGNERCAIRIRSHKKSEHQKRGVNPCQPFNFYRQNKKDVNDVMSMPLEKLLPKRNAAMVVPIIPTTK